MHTEWSDTPPLPATAVLPTAPRERAASASPTAGSCPVDAGRGETRPPEPAGRALPPDTRPPVVVERDITETDIRLWFG